MPMRPASALDWRRAHSQGDAHGAADFEAGVEFAVDALHDRELFHAGGKRLVGEGIEAGILDGDGCLTAESGEQGEVLVRRRAGRPCG